MGLGLEINFYFDKEEPSDKIKSISDYDFDSRDGLSLIMTGRDSTEVLDENERLLKLIEKQLNLDLSLLDYWNNDVYEQDINLNNLLDMLVKLKLKIIENPEFYKKIAYGFDIEERYLKSTFISDIEFLIERINCNISNGATTIKYESV